MSTLLGDYTGSLGVFVALTVVLGGAAAYTTGKLNAVDSVKHANLADVWPIIDRDPETRVVVVHGEGGAFSAGGDLDMIRDIIADIYGEKMRKSAP